MTHRLMRRCSASVRSWESGSVVSIMGRPILRRGGVSAVSAWQPAAANAPAQHASATGLRAIVAELKKKGSLHKENSCRSRGECCLMPQTHSATVPVQMEEFCDAWWDCDVCTVRERLDLACNTWQSWLTTFSRTANLGQSTDL